MAMAPKPGKPAPRKTPDVTTMPVGKRQKSVKPGAPVARKRPDATIMPIKGNRPKGRMPGPVPPKGRMPGPVPPKGRPQPIKQITQRRGTVQPTTPQKPGMVYMDAKSPAKKPKGR